MKLINALLYTPFASLLAFAPLDSYKGKLEEKGISIGGEYVAEYSDVVSGGIREDSSFRNLFTADISITSEKLKGATFFAQYLHVSDEKGGTADSGDIQAYSNIENDETLDVIYELWYEQILLDNRLRLKIGKVDANSEFNYVEAAGNFSNSSAGFSPTIFTFPSYPNPAMSINIFATLMDSENSNFVLGYGFYDGAAGADGISLGNRGPSTFFDDDLSNDYFHIVEGALSWNALGSLGGGRTSATYWHHTGNFNRFDGGRDSGVSGFNVTIEQQVATFGNESQNALHVFAQYGKADENVSEISQHIAFGFSTEGTFRENDSFGIYFTHVELSSKAGFSDDEWTLDTYYRVQISDEIFVQPELQFIKSPSGSNTIDDALVASMRAGVAF